MRIRIGWRTRKQVKNIALGRDIAALFGHRELANEIW
jgi:hypothetical protein